MPIYTDDPGSGINQPLSNVESGLGESLSASFAQGFMEGPLMSGLRFAQADQYANDPNSPVISKTEADAKLKELGVKSINIPESGVTQAFMDHVTQERKEALARNQIAAAAPSGFINTPLNFMAGLAGSMADPANLAIGLVPFAGEAKAATALGRFGERFIQGAGYGGVQTAVALPFTAMAAAADGEDYSLGNAMENIFMGMVGGGLIHAGGGVIADIVRGRRTPDASVNPEQPEVRATPTEPNPVANEAASVDLDSYIYSRAYDDVAPSFRSDLESTRDAVTTNISEVQSAIVNAQQQISDIQSTLETRVADYKQQGMKSRDARAAAKQDIASEIEQINQRRSELDAEVEKHNASRQASDELASLEKGEIPAALRDRIAARADELRQGFEINPVARAVQDAAQRIDSANWTQRENAFRAGISHMLQGRTPDIEPFFDLHRTDLRATAFDQIKQGPRPDIDEPTVRSSADADMQYQRAQKNDDLVNAQEDFDSELQLARNMVDDLDSPELKSSLESIQKEANDESFIKGIQAYATCMLRRI
ncbi:hypothetical protein N7598_02910 [Enterobacter kobei]|uniref:hypothetical protein n=1 Tax=Enterobacter kobei TaxID=208224 RepID=UPI002448C256|nr:hypothetical protein [Enterobacter kobei]ELJ5836302.1 hypothetical protein [Enterobacter kobei]MDG9912754.1 hypothetical protein [Enterobacter kobei]MDH0038198.1 hypothetical protein [Enterobacter kobei]HEG1994554.1 hypothetical protein [Enterobacter kobei]